TGFLKRVTTTPLIRPAETYEQQSEAAAAPAAPATPSAPGAQKEHDHAAHAEGWKPAEGLSRFFYTSVATIATAVGISFLLLAGMVFAGGAIDAPRGVGWANGGFGACWLARAAGLAPELPGSGAGELVARQIWWISTAIATAAALWAFLRLENVVVRLGAVVLLFLPHVIGAPHPHALESKVP